MLIAPFERSWKEQKKKEENSNIWQQNLLPISIAKTQKAKQIKLQIELHRNLGHQQFDMSFWSYSSSCSSSICPCV